MQTYSVMFAEYKRDGKTVVTAPVRLQSGLSLYAANREIVAGAAYAAVDCGRRNTALHYGGLSRAIRPNSRNIVEYWRETDA